MLNVISRATKSHLVCMCIYFAAKHADTSRWVHASVSHFTFKPFSYQLYNNNLTWPFKFLDVGSTATTNKDVEISPTNPASKGL